MTTPILGYDTAGMWEGTANPSGNIETTAGKVESALLAEKKSQYAGLRMWQPGQSGNPAGRPKKAVEQAYLDAVKKAMTPERVHDLIVELSSRTEWRAKAFAAELALHYGLGKPVQRIETDSGGLASILAVIDGRE